MLGFSERRICSRHLCARRLHSRKEPSRVQTARASSEASKIACHHEACVAPFNCLGASDNTIILRWNRRLAVNDQRLVYRINPIVVKEFIDVDGAELLPL